MKFGQNFVANDAHFYIRQAGAAASTFEVRLT